MKPPYFLTQGFKENKKEQENISFMLLSQFLTLLNGLIWSIKQTSLQLFLVIFSPIVLGKEWEEDDSDRGRK